MPYQMMPYQKKAVKHSFNKLALALFCYDLIFQVGAIPVMVFGTDVFQNLGFISMLTGGMALLFIYLLLGWQPVDTERQPFHFYTYLWLLLLFFGIQIATSYLNLPIEALVNFFGHSLEQAAEIAGGYAEDVWMLLYSVVAAPIYEELLVRGFLYGYLRRYGRVFATIITALLFGMMHGNVLQLLYAFFIGLFLAWIRESYGLGYALLLHFSNNLIVTLVSNENLLSDYIETTFGVLVFLGIITLSASIVFLIRKAYRAIREEYSLGWMLGRFFTSLFVVLLLIAYLLMTLLNLD